ncbi:14825_t:CDS:2, partial [Cetraspora pellucida]
VDTIVKINQVRQTDKEESRLTIVWAIGVYPVESEDREIEIVLFVPINEEERDPNTQSIFVKNEYYSVCGKVVPGTYNNELRLKMTVTSLTHLTIRRDLGSNRCPLKTSLIGIVQDIPKEVDDENAIFKVLVNDYAAQHYNFIMRIAFPYNNNRFKYLMNSIHPNESVPFIVGQVEIIDNDLYVYAADIFLVDVNYVAKKKFSGLNNSQMTSEIYKSIRSKLLSAHQNANEKSPEEPSIKPNKHTIDLTTENSHFSKHARVEDVEDDDDLYEQDAECSKKYTNVGNKYDSDVEIVNESNYVVCDNGKVNKGKEKVAQSVVHNMRSRAEMVKNMNEKK